MYFVHPQIKLSQAAKAKLSLIKPVNLSKLTKKLSFYFPNKQFIFTDMGREALKVIIEKMNLQNSEMLLPAYICEIFYPILKNYNIKPVFLDIDLATFQPNPEEIKRKISSGVRSILVCHTYGLPFEFSRFDLPRRSNLIVIEDCANSFGAKINNSYCGNFGDVSFFSLYKQIPTLRGGLLVCPKDWEIRLPKTFFNLRDFISFLNYFWPFSFFFKKFGSEIAPKMPRKEKLPRPGGINRASLSLFSDFFKDLEKSLENRQRLALFLQEELKKLGFAVQTARGNVFCYLSALVPEELEEKRDEIVQKLRKYRVFCTRIWHTPIILNKDAQKKYQINLAEFPNTVTAAKRVINFPLQNHYKEKDIRKIIDAVKQVIDEVRPPRDVEPPKIE